MNLKATIHLSGLKQIASVDLKWLEKCLNEAICEFQALEKKSNNGTVIKKIIIQEITKKTKTK